MPGGVGSNDRALVEPHPIFIDHGEGAYLVDVDGNRYIDYLLGYGPLVLGHAHPAIVAAVTAAAAPRLDVRRQPSARAAGRRGPRRPDAGDRDGPLRLRGDRSRARGDAARPRRHRPALHRQVRGAVPRLDRPGRPVLRPRARRRRLDHSAPDRAELGGHPPRDRRRHDRHGLERPRRPRAAVRRRR